MGDEAYATPEDFAVLYPSMAGDQRLGILLPDASDAIDRAFSSRGRDLPREAGDAALLRAARRVVCQLAAREAADERSGTDVTSSTVTAGPFSQVLSYGGAPNMRLNRADLESLGLYARAGFAC